MATIEDLKRNLRYVFKGVQTITPFIKGVPGIGKSAAVKQIAAELGLQFIDLRLSQLESADLRGVPVPDEAEGICRWLPPEFLPFKGIKRFDGTKGILLLDEFNRARPDVLQAAFQLVLDRSVGLLEIMDSWFIVAAGNLGAEDGTDVVELDSALMNRFIHFNVTYNLDAWLKWAEAAKIHPDVINFIKGKPSALYHQPEDQSNNIYVTPRSWEKFSNILLANDDVEPMEIAVSLGVSIIDGQAPAFIKYLESKEIVSPKEITDKYLKDAKIKAKLKNMSRDQIYSLNNDLVDYLSEKVKAITDTQLENVYTYCKDHCNQDNYIAFLKGLVDKSGKGKSDFINQYLKKYIEESKIVVRILENKKS